MYFPPLLSFMSYARNVFSVFSISMCFIVSGSFLPVIVAYSTQVCFQNTTVACTAICSKFPSFLKLLIARYHLSCEETTSLLLGNKYSDEIARDAIITCMSTNKCSYSFGIVKKVNSIVEGRVTTFAKAKIGTMDGHVAVSNPAFMLTVFLI